MRSAAWKKRPNWQRAIFDEVRKALGRRTRVAAVFASLFVVCISNRNYVHFTLASVKYIKMAVASLAGSMLLCSTGPC